MPLIEYDCSADKALYVTICACIKMYATKIIINFVKSKYLEK